MNKQFLFRKEVLQKYHNDDTEELLIDFTPWDLLIKLILLSGVVIFSLCLIFLKI